MFTRKSTTTCLLGVVAALVLTGCGNNAGEPASSGQTSAVAASAPMGPLSIQSWGPQTTKAGTVFNKQPNGSAALWIHVNQSLTGSEAAVEFNGALLPANVSGDLVTAGVPADLYAKPGNYKVHVIVHKGGQPTQSNDVQFVVH